ncbi:MULTISPECIES: hypothetical protein [Pseudomonas]|uniref:hypothetical protein n=1 Tax=Pseudomonas TaxID=286 RepID=UPI001A2C054D|nr:MULTISPECIES: hypothetical protein [Pseudomonas]MBJ7370695.1 hypothetical protein [Pseudomonas sp.]WGT34297.1 hypothetical protein QG303_01705 [Pseudomonas atacamensis]
MLHANPNKKRESDILKIERRAQFIKEALEEVKELKLTFEYKKNLLSYVARYIEAQERSALSSQTELTIVPTIRSVTVGGLYKSATYSALIDNWILQNPRSVLRVSKRNKAEETKLRLQCMQLSNECERLRVDLQQVRLQMQEYEEPAHKSISIVSQESLTQAYLVIDSLLDEFNGFLKIDTVGVVLDNVLRRKIIDIEIIRGYLEWKKDVIEIKGLR